MKKGILAGVGVAALFVMAWVLLPRFVTPEAAMDLRSVPAPEPVTAVVEEGFLREVVQVEGVVVPLAQMGVPAFQPDGVRRPVITYLPDAGTELSAGEVIMGISGRPIIYLGNRPNLFRDLQRGMSGPDVSEFQDFLVSLAVAEFDELNEGIFDESMEDAVELLYEKIGYSPARPPVEITPDQILSARNNVDQASQSLAAARQSGDQASINIASRNLSMARSHLQTLLESPRLVVPADETLGLPHERLIVVGASGVVGSIVDLGVPIVEIRTAKVIITSTAPRSRVSGVEVGQVAAVSTPGGSVEGVVERVMPRPDNPSDIEIVLSWDRSDAVPGERMVVEIETVASDAPVISVPVSAIRTEADGSSYVISISGQTTSRIPVVAGVTIGGRTAVTGDLAPGDLVVVGAR